MIHYWKLETTEEMQCPRNGTWMDNRRDLPTKNQWQEREAGILLCSSSCHRDGHPDLTEIKQNMKW